MKKVSIMVLVALLFVGATIVAMLLSKNTQNTDNKHPVVESEQSDTDEQQSGEGLQIQEDNKELDEDSSDASGSWEEDVTVDTTDDAAQEPTKNKQDDNQSGDASDSDVHEGQENVEVDEDEDTLIDEKIWGDIF